MESVSFNPALKAEGKPFFTLSRKFPDRAADLFAKSEDAAQARFDYLQKLVELYK